MADITSLLITSYNCRGFNALKTGYIKTLLVKATVLFLQEHWLSDDQLRSLGDIDDSFLCTGVAGFGNTEVLSGRPYGGCAIMWRSDIAATVIVIDVNSRRICGIRVETDGIRLLLINVYMPYEGSDSMTDEFADQLHILDYLMSSNSDCHILVGGDFNVDLSRLEVHTAMLDSSCSETELNFTMRHDRCHIDYTYSFNMSRFHVLDHFLLSGRLYNKSVECVSVLHDIDNMSDHEPIVLQLSLNIRLVGYQERIYTPRVSWAKATDKNVLDYQDILSQKLRNIAVPITDYCADY
jgi:exonuclease III